MTPLSAKIEPQATMRTTSLREYIGYDLVMPNIRL